MYIKKKFGFLGTFMCLVTVIVMHFVMKLNCGYLLESKGKVIYEHCTIYNFVS
jgi:hypothetical protein